MKEGIDGPEVANVPEVHDHRLVWSRLNHLQIGRYAEYFFKMRFTLLGLEVYSSEVDDRGIDFVVREEPDRYWDIQVKSIRWPNTDYIFMAKSKFRIRPNLLVAAAIFVDGKEPNLFLIEATTWLQALPPFHDRDYVGRKSAPEYGVSLTPKTISTLDRFAFDRTSERLFGRSDARALQEGPP